MPFKWKIIGLLILIVSLISNTVIAIEDKPITTPWFTGPLLAPAGATIPPGHTNYEPYFFYTDSFGTYTNRWAAISSAKTEIYSPTLVLTQGVYNRLDLEVIAAYNFNTNNGKSDSNFADTTLYLGIHALIENPHTWKPSLRLTIQETFPTGKYKNQSVGKNGTDSSGAGSYQTGISTNFQKSIQFRDGRFLRTRLDLTYTIPASVKVSGFNAYGGGIGTNGTISPGNKFSVDLAFEYTLTQHWVPAIDFVYTDTQPNNFKGIPGRDVAGRTASIGQSSSQLFSLAPGIEYNFTATVGIVAGAWFTVAGKDTSEFVAAVIALNMYV